MTKSGCRAPSPGGFAVTERAIALCGFGRGARLLDLGCGDGTTVRRLSEGLGFILCGLDADRRALGSGGNLLLARGEHAPLTSGAVDGVLLECALSRTADPDAVLAECRRVLKPGGRLALSDVYARGAPVDLRGFLGRVEAEEALLARVSGSGFTVETFEDFTEGLLAAWGQMILDRGMDALCEELGADAAALSRARCGYCLIVARKERDR